MQGTLKQDETGQWWYISPAGKRYKRYVRICESCGKEDIVQKLDLDRLCRQCYRNTPLSANVVKETKGSTRYVDDKGQCWQQNKKSGIRTKLYPSFCPDCGVESYVRKCNIGKQCNSCPKVGRIFPEHVRKQRSERMQGENNINWKGGKGRTPQGYIRVFCPDHPHANSIGYVYKHRLVAEENLGRYLRPDEEVHHIDEDKSNNAWENLLVCSGKMHRKIHAKWYKD